MNPADFNSGDILKATCRGRGEGHHPIIYIEGNSDKDFIGGMITHAPYSDRNILMEESHFVSDLPVKFDNTRPSYLVLGKFIKPEEWGPFEKNGELTLEGLEFVKENICGLPIETFSDYYERTENV